MAQYYTVRLCNQSSQATISTAVAHFADPTDSMVTIEGWWNVRKGQCVNTIRSPFGTYNSIWYLVHAHKGRLSWPGKARSDANLCTPVKAFTRKNTLHYKCRTGETLQFFRKVTIQRDTSETTISTFNFLN